MSASDLLLPKPRPRRQPGSVDLSRVRRDRLEFLIEHLIWALDQFDGDPDAEPDADGEDSDDAEPSIGTYDDLELDFSDREPGPDEIGFTTLMGSIA